MKSDTILKTYLEQYELLAQAAKIIEEIEKEQVKLAARFIDNIPFGTILTLSNGEKYVAIPKGFYLVDEEGNLEEYLPYQFPALMSSIVSTTPVFEIPTEEERKEEEIDEN